MTWQCHRRSKLKIYAVMILETGQPLQCYNISHVLRLEVAALMLLNEC